MVTAVNVGNSILRRAFTEKIDITPMKLQKMIYFVYRDYLKKTNQSLFDERFETWKYGPVLPSVYEKFKKYRANAIRDYATEGDGKTVLAVNEKNSPIFRQIIDSIWEQYKNYDGIYLSSLTHRNGSAWSEAADRRDMYLSDEDIKKEAIAFG